MPRKKKQRAKAWSHTVGTRHGRVSVFERDGPGSMLYGRIWDPTTRRPIRRSLGHRDRPRAIHWALREAQRLAEGRAGTQRRTVGRLFALYAQHRSPRKSDTEQQQDDRRIECWTRVLGADRDATDIPLRCWETFVDERSSGAIDARGHRVPEIKQRPVSARTVEADTLWLRWVYSWAVKWREGEQYLLNENPIRGFLPPKVLNVRRPVASTTRYEALRAVSDQVQMAAYRNGKRCQARSYLSEVLDLAFETGHRLSSILNLRYADYLPDATDEQDHALPYGAIRWRGEYDKQGRTWVSPLGPIARAALERIITERPGIGDAPFFPSRDRPMQPITRHVADHWLRKAEALAALEPQDGSAWHAFRRGWATARKHLNPIDTAHAGGWLNPTTMQKAYQHADMAGQLDVILGGGELRERHA